jgi:hypothetical protein
MDRRAHTRLGKPSPPPGKRLRNIDRLIPSLVHALVDFPAHPQDCQGLQAGGVISSQALIGQPHGPTFEVQARYDLAGIPAVYGVTLNGKFQTSARVVDVNFHNGPADVAPVPK